MYFFPSYNYLSCNTCPYISGSLKKKTCFRCLATGVSFVSLEYSFQVGKNMIKGIVWESVIAIWKVLQPIYMAAPTSEELLQIADEFNNICKMPNCIGSREGKHCCIKCPPHAGSLFFNYKSFHAMNLVGVADANCCCTLIVVEAHGCENNSSVFSNSSFWKVFSSGDLNVPPISNIPGTRIGIPL